MKENKPVKKLSKKEKQAAALHKTADKKCQDIVLAYFREAKDNKLNADELLKKYDTQWRSFCFRFTKNQGLIALKLTGFKERVDFFIKHAENQLKEEEAKKVKILGLDGKPINNDSNGIIDITK